MAREPGYTAGQQPFSIDGDDRTATVRKVYTRMGERLEIRSSQGDRLRVDPLALESLTWQHPQDIPGLTQKHPTGRDDEYEDAGEIVSLSNEYASVEVRKITKASGSALEITAPMKDFRVHLDPSGVLWLAAQDMSLFSGFLSNPHGPE